MTQPTVQQAMQAYLETNRPFYLQLLRQMVEMNSFTANPVGVNTLGRFTADVFAGLGFEAEFVPPANPDFGQHLVLTKSGSSGRKIGLVSHLDTVFSPEEEARNDFVWREEGGRIYGPGVVDIKGGTVVIYMTLAALKEFAPALYDEMTWVVLLDAAEERVGRDFAQVCLERLGEEALACLVFESGAWLKQTFSLAAARKGMALYRVLVEGRSAHAGNNHDAGANAIVQLADLIGRIAALTDYDRHLTFNVGVVEGGTVTNRVPHHAQARVEMRVFSPEVYQEGVASMLALPDQATVQSPKDGHPCRVKVEVADRMPPWPRNKGTDDLLSIWQETAQSLGQAVKPEERGGLSDGNFLWSKLPTLDGLGPAGGNLHCSERSEDGSKDQEYVEPGSLAPKALLNALSILRLIEKS